MQTLTITAFDIATYFLWLTNDTGSFMSNLKLQKLVYYAQAWHLALYDRPLFEEDFQAWVHGPVIPELFNKYKHFSWQPILEDAKIDLPTDIIAHLKEVADEYFRCDAYELSQMVHAETPWQQAREGLMPDQPSTNIIQKTWMQEYYKARAEED
jgi:uncharacterized phage-associated protein